MTPDAIPKTLDVARLTPSPPITADDAAEAIRACFGLSGELTRLPGEADDNFLLRVSGGSGGSSPPEPAELRAAGSATW